MSKLKVNDKLFTELVPLHKILVNYRGKNNFLVKKPGRCYLNQTIKVNIIRNSNQILFHLIGCNENRASLL